MLRPSLHSLNQITIGIILDLPTLDDYCMDKAEGRQYLSMEMRSLVWEVTQMGRKSGMALLVAVCVLGITCVSTGAAVGGTGIDKDIRILYVGRPGSDREKDFVAFLKQHFAVVQTGNLPAFKEADAKDFDVTLLDWNVNDFNSPRLKLSEKYSRPTITLGVPGGLMCSSWRLKLAYL